MIIAGNPFSIEQYQEEGYSGPIQGLTLAEADNGYNRFFEVLGQSKYAAEKTNVGLSAWHHRYRWAYDLAAHPSIVGAMRQILGNDLVLWAMHFWYKEPGNAKYIPWHQDYNYWPMNPAINATAWVSLGWSVRENGCLRIVPGTHREHLKHVSVTDSLSSFKEGLPAEKVDESRIVDVEMTPGQIVFFNEATFHGSERNQSHIPRVAFSVRYTTPEVKFVMEEWGGNKGRIRTFLVNGEDHFHYNDAIAAAPPER